MNYNSIAGTILLYITVSVISDNSIPAANYHTYDGDSTFADRVFTFGRKLDLGIRILGNDTIYGAWDRLLGAAKIRDYYVCIPILNPVGDSWQQLNDTSLMEDVRESRKTFVSFKSYIIQNYIWDQLGDTVQVVCSGGRFLALIEDMGRGNVGNSLGYCCVLKPLGEPEVIPEGGEFIMVFRKCSFYNGPIYRLSKAPLDETPYSNLSKSLTHLFLWNWKETNEPHHLPCAVSLTAYWMADDPSPDTLFILANCNLGMEWDHDYAAKYLAFFDGNKWNMNTLMTPGDGSINQRLGFGFDLNNDGITEYISLSSELTFWYWGIFIIENGKVEYLIWGDYPRYLPVGEPPEID